MTRYSVVFSCLLVILPATALAETVDARLQWFGARPLGLAVSGVIEAVSARAGALVDADDELLRLDQRPFAARLALAEANLAAIQPRRDEAEAEYERARDLLDRTVISEADFRVAEISVEQARADYAAAQAQLALVDWDQQMSRLRSPGRTWILAVQAQVGEAISSRDQIRELVRVADADHLQAEAVISARQAAALSPGQLVSVRLGRQKFAAEVHGIEQRIDNAGDARYRMTVKFAHATTAYPDFSQPVRIELP